MRPLAAAIVVLLLALVGGARAARADGDFGPRYLIERVEVRGNLRTDADVIERELMVRAGDVVGAADPRVELSRFRVLALGFFADVRLAMRRGATRGHAVLVVDVTERGTLVLDKIHFGSSAAVPFWGGVEVSENNAFGRGVTLGGAFLLAAQSEVHRGRTQHAFRLRVGIPRLFGSPVSLAATALFNNAMEPYRTSGKPEDGSPDNFTALPYRRLGGLAGIGIELGPTLRIGVDLRLENISATLSDALVRTLPDGSTTRVDAMLGAGSSWLATAALSLEYDSREDPVLPLGGTRVAVVGELSSRAFGSDWEFYKITVSWQRWFRLPWNHAISVHALGGGLVGDAPVFDQFFIGDLNPILPPRALGLVLSTQSSLNLLGLGMSARRYGVLAGRAGVEYLWPLFRGGRWFYAGHLFLGLGLVSLSAAEELRAREPGPLSQAVPLDLYVDGGLRLDTFVGTFNLSLANLLGRLPW